MHFKIQDMEAFRLFAVTGSVTETAHLLRISQPAVSQILREFENEVGVTLFRKAGRSLQLTAEATEFLVEVEDFIRHYEKMKSRAKELRTGKSGSLTIASIPTLLQHIIPLVVSRFAVDLPDIRLSLGSYTASETARRVKSGLADIGIAFLPTNDFQVDLKPLLRTAITCFMPHDHRLASRSAIGAGDLVDERIISQSASTPPGYVLRSYFSEAQLREWPTIETNQTHVALSLAEKGLGIALTHPLHLLSNQPTKLAAVPFEPEVELSLALIRPLHHQHRLVNEFETALRATLSESIQCLEPNTIRCEMSPG